MQQHQLASQLANSSGSSRRSGDAHSPAPGDSDSDSDISLGANTPPPDLSYSPPHYRRSRSRSRSPINSRSSMRRSPSPPASDYASSLRSPLHGRSSSPPGASYASALCMSRHLAPPADLRFGSHSPPRRSPPTRPPSPGRLNLGESPGSPPSFRPRTLSPLHVGSALRLRQLSPPPISTGLPVMTPSQPARPLPRTLHRPFSPPRLT